MIYYWTVWIYYWTVWICNMFASISYYLPHHPMFQKSNQQQEHPQCSVIGKTE